MPQCCFGLKNLSILSVISLRILHTKKTHTGAVEQSFLGLLEIIVLMSWGMEECMDVGGVQFSLFLCCSELLVEVLVACLDPAL